ncbi:MAG: sulfite oxidase, partial [Halobacteriaceae archaeon]
MAWRTPSRREAVVAGLAGAAAVAGSFALAGLTRSFVAAPVNRLVTDLMPGPVLSFAIVVLGDLGQQLGLALALALTAGLFGATALAALRTEGRYTKIGAGGVFAGGLGFLLTGSPPQVAVTGVPVLAVLALATDTWGSVDAGDARRRVLRVAAAVVGFGAAGTVLGSRQGSGPEFAERDPAVEPLLAEAEEKSLDVDGMDGLVSDSFYEVDINSFNPEVRDDWKLRVTGAVSEETTFDLADL